MGGDSKEVKRTTVFVQQARAPKVIDAKSQMMQKLVFAFLRTEANLRKTEQALDGVHCGWGVLGTIEKVEQTKNERRRDGEVGSEGWELGQGQTLHSIHG